MKDSTVFISDRSYLKTDPLHIDINEILSLVANVNKIQAKLGIFVNKIRLGWIIPTN